MQGMMPRGIGGLGRHFMDPTMLWTELFYTVIIVILCYLIFFKTKEMYTLSKHKGIKYFRYTFLFFGLSYLLRFVFNIFHLSRIRFEYFSPLYSFGPFFIIFVGYFSTMAIFYLLYSTVYEKIEYEKFLFVSTTIALCVSAASFATRSPLILALIQIPLIIATLVVSIRKKSEKRMDKKNKSHTKQIYYLIAIFWLTNLFVLDQRRFFPFEINVVFQIISLGIFGYIFYKVIRWTR